MPVILRRLLFLTFILCACSPSGLSPQALTSAIPTDTPIATLSTPHIDQSSNGVNTVVPSNPQDCTYQWAQQPLPGLSKDFGQSIETLQAGSQANAFAFGENCVHTDGSATFLPMETDFNITWQVSDLANESDLGESIMEVMQVIKNIPPDQIVGPRPGRVTIIFQSNMEQKVVNFYIDQYHNLSPGLSNEEIYQALQIPQ